MKAAKDTCHEALDSHCDIAYSNVVVGRTAICRKRHGSRVDPNHKTFIVSCQSIPGFMDAMTMPFDVREPRELQGLAPGMIVEFTLVVEETLLLLSTCVFVPMKASNKIR